MQFPTHFPYESMVRSQTATRRGIENTPDDATLVSVFRTAWFLESLRGKLSAHLGKDTPIFVTSGFRCLTLNKAIGGATLSAHTKGLAADIVVHGMSPLELALFIQSAMIEEGFDQLIHEFGSWVHVAIPAHTHPRLEVLTARKNAGNGKTEYLPGLYKVAA